MSADPLPTFVAHLPPPPLSQYVECLWRAQGLTPHKRERVLPNAVVEVIINLGSFHKVLEREDYARESLDFARSPHPAVAHLADRIRAWDGAVRISELVEQVALSHKRLMQLFRRDVGMTPKALAQIYRFQSVLRRIAPERSPDWSSIAAECGYYDQPHLVHEFRRLSGLTPNEYLVSRLPNLNHTVIE